MKRAFLGVIFVSAAAILGGCPMYSGGPTDTCNGDGCFVYDAGVAQCENNDQCSPGYGCTYGSCTWVGYEDGAANCSTTGCPYGQQCVLANGAVQCLSLDASLSSSGDDASSAAEASAGDGGGASPADGSNTSDAATTSTVSCNADSTCGGDGALCIDGQCVPQSGLCSDTSQCASPGAACVNGVCLPRCSLEAPSCAQGYECDYNRNVCDVNAAQCSTSAACQGGSVCVDGRCVTPCTSTEAGSACPSGLVCVNGGCIPDQGVVAFPCVNDGKGGSLANMCGASQTCLHHSCYDNCGTDAGTSCGSGLCKEVKVQAGTYAVCGTTTTLGSDCDPATGALCAGGVCIDGYCVP